MGLGGVCMSVRARTATTQEHFYHLCHCIVAIVCCSIVRFWGITYYRSCIIFSFFSSMPLLSNRALSFYLFNSQQPTRSNERIGT